MSKGCEFPPRAEIKQVPAINPQTLLGTAGADGAAVFGGALLL